MYVRGGELEGEVGECEFYTKNSEYDQEIPQSQTADKFVALRGRVTL